MASQRMYKLSITTGEPGSYRDYALLAEPQDLRELLISAARWMDHNPEEHVADLSIKLHEDYPVNGN